MPCIERSKSARSLRAAGDDEIDAQGSSAGRHVRVSVPRLFYCTVAGLVIATGVSFLYGASGLFNYRQLRAYERQVVDGIATLQERHRVLQTRIQALRDDPELLRLLARDTGYFRSDETVIEVGPTPHDPIAARSGGGDPDFTGVAPLQQHTPPAPRDPFNALALGLFLGLGLFASLTVLRALERRRKAGSAPAPAVGASAAAEPPAPARRSPGPVVADRPQAAPEWGTPPGPTVRPDAGAAATPHGSQPSPGAPAADGGSGASASRRRRSRRQRRRDVTVYRL